MNHANDQMIAWKVVLEHGVRDFDYHIISSLAVSKDLQLLLLSTADFRKKYLTKQLDLSKNVTWHKYGAMCGQVRHNMCSVCFPDEDISLGKWRYDSGLYRNRFYLQIYERDPQLACVYDSNFYSCLPHNPKPFFNKRSEYCFYGYESENWNNEKVGRIIEYVWHTSPSPWSMGLNRIQCMMNIKNKKDERIDLTVFLEFQVLLKAFLKSRVVYEETKKWGSQKVYAIAGVTIPENYKDHKPYFSRIVYKSFKDLPKNIRKAIVAQYKKQRKKD
jgi:hypothetical protein